MSELKHYEVNDWGSGPPVVEAVPVTKVTEKRVFLDPSACKGFYFPKHIEKSAFCSTPEVAIRFYIANHERKAVGYEEQARRQRAKADSAAVLLDGRYADVEPER